jgi:hypothetical protein
LALVSTNLAGAVLRHISLLMLPIRFASAAEAYRLVRRLLALGGAYTFRSGKGSRAGSGLSLARIALKVRMRGDNHLDGRT